MAEKVFIYYIILLVVAKPAYPTNSCSVTDYVDSCKYTVRCEIYAGSAQVYSCSSEPYVIFIISHSRIDALTAGFFGSTNFDSRVREIRGIENTWNSIEPYSFKYYAKSVVVDLSGNHIKTIKNEAFKNFAYLNYLNLSNNDMESLSPSSLYLSPDTSLSVLDLSNNNLTDIQYGVLNNLPRLEYLYLQNNQIEMLSDDSLSSLKNLTKLILHHNKIETLNMMLINLKSLKELDMSFNKLKKIAGYETNRLFSLEILNMSHNAIEILESNCFNQAPNLKIVDFSNNRIMSTIEVKMFINNAKLQYLNLYNNKVKKIEDGSFEKSNLTYINLENNFISGEITNTTFVGLSEIKYLCLYNQNITALKSKAFTWMRMLANLNLSVNSIQYIDKDSFNEMNSLHVLDLSHNNISSSVDVENLMHSLSKLRTLSLGGNPLSCKEIVRSIKITTMRLLEVTSIDKVYHEDNVYGITCGDDSVSNKTVNYKIDQNHQDSITQESTLPNIVLIWCSLLTVACVVIGVTVFIYKKKRNGVSRLHLRHSVELNGSECPTDLLT
ncbi:unnamed protein product [Parnassius mnemosyne]|uniref:Uncharacterized protein n=1 Tax=Parnassius mnemosyne TaxID=213953 RepID=A0AAV1KP47_9NEOP